MFEDKLISQISLHLKYSLDRQKYLADNIANINTPGYKRKDLVFLKTNAAETTFHLKKTRKRHIDIADNNNSYEFVKEDNSTSIRTDGNNVDLEKDMALLTKNSLYYQSLLSFARFRFSLLKRAIEGR